MIVRSIRPSELDRFAAVGQHALGAEGFAQYIRDLWDSGSSQPERCFVVESDGEFVGRVAYRGHGEEVDIFGLYLPWDADYITIGKRLLQESLAGLREQGVERLESFVISQWPHVDHVRSLYETIGFPMIQEKVRYEWIDDGQLITFRHDLVYRSLPEVGDEAFIDAIRRVSVDTLDRLDQQQIPDLGAEAHAREYFNLLKNDFVSNPNWWLLAYTPSEDLVGQVVGIPFNNGGSIGYIGVVPEQRGHGYIHDLLAKGMQVMYSDGLNSFVCDTDVLNQPMRHAFEARGYYLIGSVWVYRSSLDTCI